MKTAIQRPSFDYPRSSHHNKSMGGMKSHGLIKHASDKAKNVSLSTYFPKGTHYFYGYPAGEDSGFLNLVPPTVEELVAERAISIAGEHVSVIGFAATHHPQIDRELKRKFNLPHIRGEQLMLLPKHANAELVGEERNKFIKASLLNMIKDSNLVMAQPYTSVDMNKIYQIPAELISYLNDKKNMSHYIGPDFLPKRLAIYKNGKEFKQKIFEQSLPFVVKASSSSCGDGVYLCRTEADLNKAVSNLQTLQSGVLVEQYIKAVKNYGVHFGISYDSNHPIDFLGVNEQITTDEGEFIGGFIESRTFPEELEDVKRYLHKVVLPEVRSMGWYGIGGFDVLADEDGKHYFIDSNFRMTGMSAYHFLVANNVISAPLLSFGGEFEGEQDEFEAALLPYANSASLQSFMQIIALNRSGNSWNFNAAVFFDTKKQLYERIQVLLKIGVKSKALEKLISLNN